MKVTILHFEITLSTYAKNKHHNLYWFVSAKINIKIGNSLIWNVNTCHKSIILHQSQFNIIIKTVKDNRIDNVVK